MPLTKEYVMKMIGHLIKYEGPEMMEFMHDDIEIRFINDEVKSTVASGVFRGKVEYMQAQAPFATLFVKPADFTLDTLIVSGNTAVVELKGVAIGKKTNIEYPQYLCWVYEFNDNEEKPQIVKARGYLDSALMSRYYEENKD
ncbi:hypothetical protein I302_104533 [Kwoniella bestiolae CBS 10118]|uniref:SnoaL-like domain-containing protein n=1 Tax=Kwoniella bestiolae CBS 10118 TaxID=1296100 RepID=A0A1B9GBI5_9TREE|nr:hypothetical protein I302_03239 [Kwoniella bestiolae CBS 10118]OCF28380.1 hypothetical protein I302_03239 [Kwoniella bestiolae CBS 10118]